MALLLQGSSRNQIVSEKKPENNYISVRSRDRKLLIKSGLTSWEHW